MSSECDAYATSNVKSSFAFIGFVPLKGRTTLHVSITFHI